MLRKLSQCLLTAIAAASTLTSTQAQTASEYWLFGYSGPNQSLTQEHISDPGSMTGSLLGGGAYVEAGVGYAWMEGVNAVVGAPEYSPGVNRGTLHFRVDRIDFEIEVPTIVLIKSEFFFEAEGISNAQSSFTVVHLNSSGISQGQTTLHDRGYAEGAGINRTSTPWEITLNPGDFLRVQSSTLQVSMTTWDLNLNGFEDPSDVFFSRIVVSSGLIIETEAEFTSELGGFYTGAMPLTIPEPSTYALLGIFGFVFATLRRRNMRGNSKNTVKL